MLRFEREVKNWTDPREEWDGSKGEVGRIQGKSGTNPREEKNYETSLCLYCSVFSREIIVTSIFSKFVQIKS